MMKRLLSFSIFSCLILSSCQLSQVSTLLNLSKSVLDLVDSFMKLHNEFTSHANEVISTTQKSLQAKENTLSDIAKFWDFQWDKIENQYASLSEQLQKIKMTSQQYFDMLDSNNRSINDTALRRMDFERTQIKRQQWNDQYNKAANNLKKAKKLVINGKDWLKIIANAAAREQLDSFIKEMEQMSYTAQFSLPAEIKDFETNAKNIFRNE
ncbi:MAG TPA: hypothetical protein VHD83_06235 [Puia sp.]|nr:hypothetical protein [Puia sp.]